MLYLYTVIIEWKNAVEILKKGIENKQYDEFYDFIVAPQEYLESNMEAKQYTYRVSYEEMLSVLKDVYSVELLNKAIEEKKSGYIIIENKSVTNFWEQYYSFIKNINMFPKSIEC